jgi:hypothetical protein
MNAWWVAIGLIAWFGASLAVGLLLARGFRRSSQAREALDAQERETLAGPRAAQDGPRVARRHLSAGAGHLAVYLAGAALPVGVVPAPVRVGRLITVGGTLEGRVTSVTGGLRPPRG